MLSVAQSAEILGVSPQRVRAMISQNVIPAEKIGRAWVLREKDVLNRLHRVSRNRHAGKMAVDRSKPPAADCAGIADCAALVDQTAQAAQAAVLHAIFQICEERYSQAPDIELIQNAQSDDEAAFLVAISDFFLQRKQCVLVESGCY